jgi:hypothetical protein
MKKKMIFLSVAMVFLLTIPAYSQFMLTDAFDSFNPDLWWNSSHHEGYAMATSGYLELGTTQGVRGGRGQASSVFNLGGDFDTYIDFDLAKFDDYFSSATFGIWATDNSFAMLMSRKYDVNSVNYYEEVNFMVDGTWRTGFSGENADMNGNFRLSRSGYTVSAYYFGSDWQQAGSFTLPSGYTSDVRVFMEAGNDGDAGNAPGVEVRYDNFYAEASNINGVGGGYVFPNPEPGTLILLGSGLLGIGALSRFRRKRR